MFGMVASAVGVVAVFLWINNIPPPMAWFHSDGFKSIVNKLKMASRYMFSLIEAFILVIQILMLLDYKGMLNAAYDHQVKRLAEGMEDEMLAELARKIW